MMKQNYVIKFRIILLIILTINTILGLLPANTFAQAGKSELIGEVTDANGASIPSARVSLTETATKKLFGNSI